MAHYATVKDFQDAVRSAQYTTRGDFLRQVIHATIANLEVMNNPASQYPQTFEVEDGCKTVFFLQARSLLPSTKCCHQCGASFFVTVNHHCARNQVEWIWRGPRVEGVGCQACRDKKPNYLEGTILE